MLKPGSQVSDLAYNAERRLEVAAVVPTAMK
jgi:hypothetical protein